MNRKAKAMASGRVLDGWRLKHWPPKSMRQCGDLPIYIGDHACVTAFAETLREAMASASDHVMDNCSGKVPRWLCVPKIVFNAERVNLVRATAKASESFDSIDSLPKRCGKFNARDVDALTQWLEAHPGEQLVAHKPFPDLRAYVFVTGEARAERVRYYRSGLVVSRSGGGDVVVQDHRRAIRTQRSDALKTSLAKSDSGWEVFVPMLGGDTCK